MEFEGKVALVTGSSRGIGRATAVDLARNGAELAINFKSNQDAAASALEAVKEQGATESILVQADLEDGEAIVRMVDNIRETFGRLDVFVANAAATAFKPLDEQKPYNVERTLNLVVRGFVHCLQQIRPLMEGHNGKVVAVSGYDALGFLPRHSILGAAKAALETLVTYASWEYRDAGINVNGVRPGLIETDSARYYAGDQWDQLRQQARRFTSKGRMGDPEDVAGLIRFLVSDHADYINGEVIAVDGGLTTRAGPPWQ